MPKSDVFDVKLKPLSKKDKEFSSYRQEETFDITFGKKGKSYLEINAIGMVHAIVIDDEDILTDRVSLVDLVKGYKKSLKK